MPAPHGSMPEPQDEVVCVCRNLTVGMISDLLSAGMAHDQIADLTGASRVCVEAVLSKRERLYPRHVRFSLKVAQGFADAPPGSYIGVTAEIRGRRLNRSYTLTRSDIRSKVYEIVVRREENGLFSRWLCEHATIGESLSVSGPFGGDHATAQARLLFIAGGIGITPAISRLREAWRVPLQVTVHWSARFDESSGLLREVADLCRKTPTATLTTHNSTTQGRVDFSRWRGPCGAAGGQAYVCGPPAFMEDAEAALLRLGWPCNSIRKESFLPIRPVRDLHRISTFDYTADCAIAKSFRLRKPKSALQEAVSFQRQFYYEVGSEAPYADRDREIRTAFASSSPHRHSVEELSYGARIAWRNSTRCIGRFFWQTLTIRDFRSVESEQEVFQEIVNHLRIATNEGDLRPVITIFRPGNPQIRILNPQLILYAGYRQQDGTVIGDPKNTALTRMVQSLGWKGRGTEFDILPLLIKMGNCKPKLFELPTDAVLEVELEHPEQPAFAELNLKWFAVPAVSDMALDVGGIQYTAAPSSGVYMGTEIGSFNLADPSRYNKLGAVARALRISNGDDNPLWRDQALVEMNRAVIHSFRRDGVRIMDHHALSRTFMQFKKDEYERSRPVYGHWPWIVPPMSSNLTEVWHDTTLKNVILKPNYFYQGSRKNDPIVH